MEYLWQEVSIGKRSISGFWSFFCNRSRQEVDILGDNPVYVAVLLPKLFPLSKQFIQISNTVAHHNQTNKLKSLSLQTSINCQSSFDVWHHNWHFIKVAIIIVIFATSAIHNKSEQQPNMKNCESLKFAYVDAYIHWTWTQEWNFNW